jgi:hypothetical protein
MPSKKSNRRASRATGAVKSGLQPAVAARQTASAEEQSRTRQDRTLKAVRAERARQAELERQGYCF